ncbi:hypothetical protein G5B37_10625 [Rasiella rasia]|uniref:Uncharacterized protein n=1 Tax=Rasiella rasia TaxID=2744027 RepID=A0A6G6GQK8_9FLAO|nr:hypothetical protein [Rasiella rasia]QIE60001.1 hypothetical protein G5B37_10625 [Rasiella rasia]
MNLVVRFLILILIISSGASSIGQTLLRGTILDGETKQPIGDAKFGISNQGIGAITNKDGKFTYRKYHHVLSEASTFEVSAKGYISLRGSVDVLRKLQNKRGKIYLEKISEENIHLPQALGKITVFWDASSKTRARDTEREITFLKEFLTTKSGAEVRVVIFNESIVSNTSFSISEATTATLIQLIENVSYKGYSDYSLLEIEPADEILLFAENKPMFGTFQLDQNIPVHSINSGLNTISDLYFESLADFTSGSYKKLRQNEHTMTSVTNESYITGQFLQGEMPVPYAIIAKEGSLQEFNTDAEGYFKVPATAGDRLTFYSLGNYPKTLTVASKTLYQVMAVPKAEQLAEVNLKASYKRSEYAFDSILQLDMVEGREVPVRSVHKSQFNRNAFTIGDAIDGIYGARSYYSPRQGQTYITVGGGCARVFVDGVEMRVESIPVHLVENISIFKSYSRVLPCPSRIIVTTRLHKDRIDQRLRKKGYEQLKNNFYTEEVPILNFDAVATDYLIDVDSKLSTKIKLEKYRSLRKRYKDKVDFYVEMALYFYQLDAGAAREVRNDFAFVANDNVKALRILAYLHEHAREFLQAQKVYTRILEMAPNEPQSYRDLALMFQETGAYDKSLELYLNMLGNGVPGVDFTPLHSVLSNELQRLINLYKHKIDYHRLPNDWLVTNFNIDVRMTATWSDTNVPFEFQFVNPEKRFYNWNSDDNITKKALKETTTEEFVIDDAQSGNWLINVRYTGDENASNIPPYLKYTVYKNFGTPQEQRQIKLVKLDTQIKKVTLDSFNYSKTQP